MIQKWVLICGFLGICSLGICQDYTAYINRYKSIAIAEMNRTGIPASITLSQAILESNCGLSDLACKANNHFGIKCGNDWTGKAFHKEDDDYKDGTLIESCFREFASVYDSYVAHSNFLSDPAKANRYSFLFSIPSTDYAGWAKGLSKAGYATDPQYAKRLIDIIEKYQLNELDTEVDGLELTTSVKHSISHRSIRYQNDVKYIVASAGDSPASLADLLDLSPRQIVRYNDDIRDENQNLVAGSYVYLQPKRNKYNGHQQYHLMKANEDLVSVSQKYGIKLGALLKRNGLTKGQVPLPNQKIMLKGKTKHAIHTADPYMPPPPQQEETKVINETTSNSSVIEIKSTSHADTVTKVVVNASPIKKTPPVMDAPGHVVAKGDTLFSIASNHGLKVEELKKMNNLSVDTIYVGQKLLLK